MKLKDFKLDNSNHFIAMEYYRLILNRIFLILITEKEIVGLKVNGMIGSQTNSGNIIIQKLANNLAIKNELENPYSYVDDNYLDNLIEIDIYSDEILQVSSSNFKILKNEIVSVTYSRKKKWGMGPYPHDGKVYVRTENKRKEFIIMRNQSGEQIKTLIEN